MKSKNSKSICNAALLMHYEHKRKALGKKSEFELKITRENKYFN